MEKFNIINYSKSSHTSKIKINFKSDLDKSVILENFNDRAWEELDDDDESNNWNFYWASVSTIRNIFSGKWPFKLMDNQILNHFPSWFELCRKDHLAKNIKKYKKQLIKEGKQTDVIDFLPITYILPGDMTIFTEEFKRNPNYIWILKPSNRSQGSGICLVNKLNKVKKLKFESKTINENNQTIIINDSYVISRYIDNPLLVSNKKFDIRMYVLVTSFHPLKIWFFKYGFCRFCNENFSIEINDIDNIYAHLTNVAIQKKYEKYNSSHGGKWPLKNFKSYVEMIYGYDKMHNMINDIKNIFIYSLKSVQPVMCSDKHCFELYGYDILIDSNLKPWLIEVNASPSLSTTTVKDKILKKKLISDIIEVVLTEKWIEEKGKPGVNSNQKQIEGDFEVIYDEGLMKESKKNKVSSFKEGIYHISSKQKKSC